MKFREINLEDNGHMKPYFRRLIEIRNKAWLSSMDIQRRYIEAGIIPGRIDTPGTTKITEYKLTRMDKGNLMRSLGGPAKLSKSGTALLCFATRSARLPEEFEQVLITNGGSYIEAYTQGKFDGEFLLMMCSGRTAKNGMFEYEVAIRPSEILSPAYVSFEEAFKTVIQPCFCPVCEKRFDIFWFTPAKASILSLEGSLCRTCTSCHTNNKQGLKTTFMGPFWELEKLEFGGWVR